MVALASLALFARPPPIVEPMPLAVLPIPPLTVAEWASITVPLLLPAWLSWPPAIVQSSSVTRIGIVWSAPAANGGAKHTGRQPVAG